MDRYNIPDVTSNRVKNSIENTCIRWAGGMIKQKLRNQMITNIWKDFKMFGFKQLDHSYEDTNLKELQKQSFL
jgi:hypothetical protein